jgi:hypothetical protein
MGIHFLKRNGKLDAVVWKTDTFSGNQPLRWGKGLASHGDLIISRQAKTTARSSYAYALYRRKGASAHFRALFLANLCTVDESRYTKRQGLNRLEWSSDIVLIRRRTIQT